MRKRILLPLLIIISCVTVACSNPDYDKNYEQGYEKGYEQGYYEGYSEFENDYLDSTNDEEYVTGCAFCWEEYKIDLLVRVNINSTDYYFCAECITNYFENIAKMTPCYYCISCGELTSDNKYIHSWSDEIICEKCISKYKQCNECKKYDTELRNNICGICGDF